MRSRWALLFVALVALGVLGSAFFGSEAPTDRGPPPQDTLVQPNGTESVVWPYTSREYSVEGRTLALNVLVMGDPEKVRQTLMDRSNVDWYNASTNESTNATLGASPWTQAHGSKRYTYIARDPQSRGRWVEPDYQLATGSYFGSRTHIRAYPGPSDSWTALQAHTEYWDWFRLRHTVTGVDSGARYVEEDFRDEPFVDDVHRFEHGQRGGGSDGSMTVVRLASAVPLLGLAVALGRRDLGIEDAVLPAALFALVIGVRAAGIAAQIPFPTVTPKLFVGLLYPILAAGPLVVAARFGHARPAVRTALLAAAGLATALLADMWLIGVTDLPLRILLHRIALGGALGLFTLGISLPDRRIAGSGVVTWVVLLAATLAGVV